MGRIHDEATRSRTGVYGAAALILGLGAAATAFFSRADAAALAVASRGMLMASLAGLVVTAVVALTLALADRKCAGCGDDGRGGDATPLAPSPPPAPDDVDAELFRLIDEQRARAGRSDA